MNITAAMWSAVAASFAALSSILIMLLNRRNLLETVRPELVISAWSRSPGNLGIEGHEVLSFSRIRNVGKGVALRGYVTPSDSLLTNDKAPSYVFSTLQVDTLAPSESIDLPVLIDLYWGNAPEGLPTKHISPTIVLLCWDVLGRRHAKSFRLFVTPLTGPSVMGANTVVANVSMAPAFSIIRSARLLNAQKLLSRVPGLSRLAPSLE